MTGLSVSKVVRGLEGFVRTEGGTTVRKHTERPYAVRFHADGNVW